MPNFYLERYGIREQLIEAPIHPEVGIIVVIPCHNEPDLLGTLEALRACEPPEVGVEVIVVVNHGVHAAEAIKTQNQITTTDAHAWMKRHNTAKLAFHLIEESALPRKHAGVGLARKIGMDEAVRRLDVLQKPDGIVVCFDADCRCATNYLVAIEQHFRENPKTPGCSIYYEHPIEGGAFDAVLYAGIVSYELFLRYYNQAFRFTGHPAAFHTVGSSMAVRSMAYQKQGGMNKRKAGEDFYFIHKIIALGDFTELHTTKVIPSPRTSDRVPFGTGKAMQDYVDAGDGIYATYPPDAFIALKSFFGNVRNMFANEQAVLPLIDTCLADFLKQVNWREALLEIRKNAATESAFVKRFFRWFDAFKVLKFVHYYRDQAQHNIPVLEAVNAFGKHLQLERFSTEKEALLHWRKVEREQQQLF